MQNHKYSLSDVESLIPWEREIYLNLLLVDLEEQRKEQERKNR